MLFRSERLWRSLKYEEVYLNAYASVAEAKAGICQRAPKFPQKWASKIPWFGGWVLVGDQPREGS